MPTPTTRNRFRKPDSGSDNNVWGTNLNSGMFDLIDESLDGWTTISTATGTLTSTQYVTNQARKRLLKYTSTGGIWTIPNLEKWYIVWNAGSGDLVLTAGGVTATVKPNDVAIVICDGTDCKKAQFNDFNGQTLKNLGAPSANTDAATKLYVDSTAFAAGSLPGITAGTANQFVTNNGASASWGYDGLRSSTTISTSTNLTLDHRNRTVTVSATPLYGLASPTDRFVCRLLFSTKVMFIPLGATVNGYTSMEFQPGDLVELACYTVSGTLAYTVVFLNRNTVNTNNLSTLYTARQERSSGTAPSPTTTTAGGYTTVGFTTESSPQSWITLTSNAFTVQPGRYYVKASCPATNTGRTRLVLYNTTTGSIVAVGQTSLVSTATEQITFEGPLNITTASVSNTVELRLYTELAGGNLGIAAGVSGVSEVYSNISIERLNSGTPTY